MDCSTPGSSVHGNPQARILEFGLSFPSQGDLPDRDQACIERQILYQWATREALFRTRSFFNFFFPKNGTGASNMDLPSLSEKLRLLYLFLEQVFQSLVSNKRRKKMVYFSQAQFQVTRLIDSKLHAHSLPLEGNLMSHKIHVLYSKD